MALSTKFKDVMNRATAGATAAALSAALIFNPAVSNDAYAQSMQPANASQQVKIPFRDIRGGEPEGVLTSAGIASKGGQVVVFFGDNQVAYTAMRSGIEQAIKAGIPFKGLVLASPLTSTPNDFTIMIMTDGIISNKLTNTDTDLANSVFAKLYQGGRFLSAKKVAALDNPTASR
jgi:hypothetical protein